MNTDNFYWQSDKYDLCESEVSFDTDRADLKYIFDECERLCMENIKAFNDYDVLIEGAKYNGVWLETQPLGGEMYAKRNVRVALNNILIFLLNQRRDGKLPGMISYIDEWKGLTPHFDWMQGCFLPYPALKMYYHIGKNKGYLRALYTCLEDFDNYLWTYRDSTGSGCLENWCIWDVGEDNCTLHLLHGLSLPENGLWGKSAPPEDYGNMPHKSPQYMAYSYACRDVLSRISAILENGKENHWRQKADCVRQNAREQLWDEDKAAMYVRDKNGDFVYALTQENIKCMYSGLFTQEMADKFIERHLLNEDEFLTPYPLPAIAANNPYFHVNDEISNCAEALKASGGAHDDLDDNSWSGPLNGLIYQRSIDALINYNHHYETVLIGKRFLEMLYKNKRFVQNYHPFTGEAAKGMNGYGPTMLAALEYISILCGVNIAYDEIMWSCAPGMGTFSYTQRMYGSEFTLKSDGQLMTAYINGDEVFSATVGARVKTDMQGKPLCVFGICDNESDFCLTFDGKIIEKKILPNTVLNI